MSKAELVSIPVVDVREGGPVRHAVDACARARALRDDCVTWLPRGARMLLPAMDAVTRRWLQRSHSPYVTDLEAIAVALGFPGIWFLNGTYQWGCTAVARDEDGVPWLARTRRPRGERVRPRARPRPEWKPARPCSWGAMLTIVRRPAPHLRHGAAGPRPGAAALAELIIGPSRDILYTSERHQRRFRVEGPSD